MFTGIVEEVGKVVEVETAKGNLTFSIQCSFFNELVIDQSISHNGVCLTVIELDNENTIYKVTAVRETLQKTNLATLEKGGMVNLERAMKFNGRVDGHIVQGHVDRTILCTDVQETEGSWIVTFELDPRDAGFLIEKGSVTLNGVSLTVFDVTDSKFSVTLIPYTFENTTFQRLKKGEVINVEYDVIGKYVSKQLSALKKLL